MKMFFKNVDYIVNNVKILDNVDFSIAPEKFTSVVGSNGSGKTTLLSLLTSNIYPTSGQIIAPISEKISYIPQTIQDPPFLKVYEIVLSGMTLLNIEKKYKYKLLDKYLSQCGDDNNELCTWGDGDSLDRERVRDILLEEYNYKFVGE